MIFPLFKNGVIFFVKKFKFILCFLVIIRKVYIISSAILNFLNSIPDSKLATLKIPRTLIPDFWFKN